MHSTNSSRGSEGISVAIRIRPLNEREVNSGQEKIFRCQGQYNAVSQVTRDGQVIEGQTTYFDKVFDESAHNKEVYQYIGKDIVHGVMSGINGTIFACKFIDASEVRFKPNYHLFRWPNKFW